jgi:hypothetical protein
MMATQPKPKPKPEPDPPEPKPEDDDAARQVRGVPTGATGEAAGRTLSTANASGNSLADRVDALFTSQTALIERVERLEERVNAPPIGLGRRP